MICFNDAQRWLWNKPLKLGKVEGLSTNKKKVEWDRLKIHWYLPYILICKKTIRIGGLTEFYIDCDGSIDEECKIYSLHVKILGFGFHLRYTHKR